MRKRIEWLDIAKGIGILTVVASHCIAISDTLCQLIFVFHMPLFFLLSGYTFSAKDSFPKTLFKKARALLVPFFLYFAVGVLTVMAIPVWRQAVTSEALLRDIVFATPNTAQNSSIWFLVCLFFVTIVYYILHKLPLWMQIPLIAVLFYCGMWYAKVRFQYPVWNNPRLPFVLDILPAGMVFYALGHYARRWDIPAKLSASPLLELSIAIIGILGTLTAYKYNGYVNTHALQFNNPLWYLVGGLCGTLAVFGISALIARLQNGAPHDGKRILMWYGRNSLTVLGFQSLLIRLYALSFNTFRGGALAMYAFPWSHAINSFILVAFIACPILVFVVNRIRDTKTIIYKSIVKDS